MALIEDPGRKPMNARQGAGQTGDQGEVARLGSLIAERKKQLSAQCFALGKAYYQAHREDESPEFADAIAAIGRLFDDIAEAEDELRRIRGLKKCPGCGTDIPAVAVFCPNCGTQVGTPPRRCPVCGRPVRENARFCASCGAKVE
ncbi:MAG: zinc ribbon domain-containing protein [Oscillospiraceae bacterium]|nr:zinc ribbon domain-containing protein [Oscillospiraceae bacterium]